MKKNNYLFVAVMFITTNAIGFYGGSDYTPSYEGRAGAGYITPSRFAPIGYTKNTGWDSQGQRTCSYNGVCRNGQAATTTVKRYLDEKPIIRQR